MVCTEQGEHLYILEAPTKHKQAARLSALAAALTLMYIYAYPRDDRQTLEPRGAELNNACAARCCGALSVCTRVVTDPRRSNGASRELVESPLRCKNAVVCRQGVSTPPLEQRLLSIHFLFTPTLLGFPVPAPAAISLAVCTSWPMLAQGSKPAPGSGDLAAAALTRSEYTYATPYSVSFHCMVCRVPDICGVQFSNPEPSKPPGSYAVRHLQCRHGCSCISIQMPVVLIRMRLISVRTSTAACM